MKKIISICLLFVLLLTSCVNWKLPLDETGATTSGENETTIPPEGTETTTQNIPPPTPPENQLLFENIGYATLKDLYTLLKERSDDANDYERLANEDELFERIVENIPDANVLITPDDLNVPSKKLEDSCGSVEVYVKNSFYESENIFKYWYLYGYGYDEYLMMEVFYAPEHFSPTDPNGLNYYYDDYNTPFNIPLLEGGLSAFLENPLPVHFYTEEMEDCMIAYMVNRDFTGYHFFIITDDFRIHISLEAKLNDSASLASAFKNFFREDTYLDAVQQAIDGIKNRD